MVKNLPANAEDTRDVGSIPGLGKSPGVGNDNLLQYSCLENSMDRRSLMGYSSQGCKELDMTERLINMHVCKPGLQSLYIYIKLYLN